jgi:FkbM family methyltransferase
MIINREYFMTQFSSLLQKKVQSTYTEENKEKLTGIGKIFRPFWKCLSEKQKGYIRMVYKMFAGIKQQDSNHFISYTGGGPFINFASDFIQYCFQQNINFDTHEFFPIEDDSYIQTHIENRIKCVLSFPPQAMNEEQLRHVKLEEQLQRNCHREREKERIWYKLSHENMEYYLPVNAFCAYTFYYHYGLDILPDMVIQNMKDKDFLDIGAFVGDVSLMLLRYSPRNIYAYEPIKDICSDLYRTIEKNGVKKYVHAINKGVGNEQSEMEITVNGAGSSFLFKLEQKTEKIAVTTIDIESKDKIVGLIKMDVEGFEYFVIQGGLETIKRDKPVMLIAIYHTGKDFFEILPMIKNAVPEYKFRYIDNWPTRPVYEKIFVCYV